MKGAVNAAGQVYDPQELAKWLAGHDTDPLTRVRLWTKCTVECPPADIEGVVGAVRAGAFPWFVLQRRCKSFSDSETVCAALSHALTWVGDHSRATVWPEWVLNTFQQGLWPWVEMHLEACTLAFRGILRALQDSSVDTRPMVTMLLPQCASSNPSVLQAILTGLLTVYTSSSWPSRSQNDTCIMELGVAYLHVQRMDSASLDLAAQVGRLIDLMLDHHAGIGAIGTASLDCFRGLSEFPGEKPALVVTMARCVHHALHLCPENASVMGLAAQVLAKLSLGASASAKEAVASCVARFCEKGGCALWTCLTNNALHILQMLRACRASVLYSKVCGDFATAALSCYIDRWLQCDVVVEALQMMGDIVRSAPIVDDVKHLVCVVSDIVDRHRIRMHHAIGNAVFRFLDTYRTFADRGCRTPVFENFALAVRASGDTELFASAMAFL